MYTILERNEKSIIVDKSEFIGIICHVTTENEVKDLLLSLKKIHPKARHICYAYRIGEKSKFSDDGEPSGTAGKPILHVIESQELDEVVVFVVRYFGGVLLGASRLLSAYVTATTTVIDDSDIHEIAKKFVYHAILTYPEFDTLKRISRKYNYLLENIIYDDKISLDILIDSSNIDELIDLFPQAEIEVSCTRKIYLNK